MAPPPPALLTTSAPESSLLPLPDSRRHELTPEDASPLHILMAPFPIQGQINPMMQLAKILVRRHGVRVTLVMNAYNHRRVARSWCAREEEEELEEKEELEEEEIINGEVVKKMMGGKMKLVALEDGMGERWGSLVKESKETLMEAMERMGESIAELIPKLRRPNAKPPACAVVGTCFHVAHAAARRSGLPTFLLWTQPAALFSIYLHIPLLVSHGFFPYTSSAQASSSSSPDPIISYIPGVPPIHPSDLPTLLRTDHPSDDSLSYITKQFHILHEYSGVLINSFEHLESETLKLLGFDAGVPVSSVGPILPLSLLGVGGDESEKKMSLVVQEEQEAQSCIEWLDKQAPRSVLYISFGSLFSPSLDDLRTIASAVVQMKQPFLWVIRSGPSSPASAADIFFPLDTFHSAMSHGLITSWAPQLHVLSHPSLAAFLSHCGWNSLLESISFGVPIISCPLLYDQVTNAKLVADVSKIGTRLRHAKPHDDDDKLQISDVQRAVHVILHEEEGQEMKRRIEDLRMAARKASRVGGTSDNHLRLFINAIRDGSNQLK